METRRSRVSTSIGNGAVGRRTPSFDGCSISARVIDTRSTAYSLAASWFRPLACWLSSLSG